MPRQTAASPARKPARRAVQARSRNTVEVILEAAARILAADGWAAFNTNAVARIAGVSIGSVYEYFANKEAILDVLLDRHLASGEAQIAGLAGIASDALSLDEIVRLLVEGFIAVHQDNPKLHRVLSAEVPISDRQRDRINHIRSRAIALLADLLNGRAARPQLKAAMMIDAADALTHRWFVDEQGVPARPDEMTQELRQMLRSYLTQ
ncbi:TetR/AcrR family transcriptional regulator [Erythrobacter sanguineus]|uniref:Transcriptional regulator, TetR family n=1 Tax=Erythrobacter sanguineus TaxID=198312 RepID=A0A1M7SID3_9SPHN|nr:TetR/AcrR family transcriptional regulator [Erythrobacter sanguineus]SHN58190.1 transcriptional regulator, TetR family [Erythrobacter sanguineus]